MPQMAPLNWLSLFISFIIILLMFNSMNYFLFDYSIKQSQAQKINNMINWKW